MITDVAELSADARRLFHGHNGNNEEQFRGGLCASHPDALDESIPPPTRHQRKFLQEKQFVRTAIDVLPDLRMPLPRSGSARLRREIVSYFDIKILSLFFSFFSVFSLFFFFLPLIVQRTLRITWYNRVTIRGNKKKSLESR